MSNFIFLLGVLGLAFIVLNPIIGYLVDNNTELNEEQERKLTDRYK